MADPHYRLKQSIIHMFQQLNIQNLGPNGPSDELQAGTIHYYSPSRNIPDSQRQSYPSIDQQFCP